jgi:hypothetical protein
VRICNRLSLLKKSLYYSVVIFAGRCQDIFMIRHILPHPSHPQPLPFRRPHPKGRGINKAAYGLSHSWTRRYPIARTLERRSSPAAVGQGEGQSLHSFSLRSCVVQVRSPRRLQVFARRGSLTLLISPMSIYEFNFIRAARAVMGGHLFPGGSQKTRLKKISPSTPFERRKRRATRKEVARPLLRYV